MNIVVILVIALLAYWWANQGFFSGLLHFICVVCAAAIAFAWWEPLAYGLLLGSSKWNGLVPGSMLLLLFLVSLLILRSITDKVAGGNTRIPRPIDATGGAIFGAASGLVTAGMLVIGTGFIDIPEGTLGHTGWGVDGNGRVHEETGSGQDYATQLWIPVDTLTARLFEGLSMGSLHPDIDGRPMAAWNPYLDRQATLLRTRLRSEDPYTVTQLAQAPGSVTIAAPLSSTEANGTTWWMIPMEFSKEGMDLGRGIAIGNTQVRLVGTTDDGTSVRHPRYWSQTMLTKSPDDGSPVESIAFFEFEPTTAYLYGRKGDKAAFNLLFAAPDDSFQPRFIQIRGTRFDLQDARPETDWEDFCLRAGAVGEPSEHEDPWGGNITALVDMKGGLPRAARPSVSDFIGGSPEFSEQGNRIVRADATQYGNKSKGKGKLKVSGYGVERLEKGAHEDQRVLDEEAAIIKIRVGPGTIADIAKLARRMGGDGAITLNDSLGNSYSPYGFELKNDTKTIISFNVAIDRWSDIRHRPKSDSDQFSLIFVLPVGVSLDTLMLDDTRVGFFEGKIAAPPRYR